MFKLRIAIFGGAAALALGAATAFAMTETGVSGDTHGSLVASAARTCPHTATGVRGAHGACVSAVASSNGQAHRSARANQVHACKAAERAATAGGSKKAGGTSAAHRAFVACVTNGKSTGSGSASSSESESDSASD
jgi:hypothetical protein